MGQKTRVGEFLFLASFESNELEYLSKGNACLIKNLKFNSVLKTNQTSNQNSPTRFLSYFFVKKISLSRRVEYVMDGSMDQ